MFQLFRGKVLLAALALFAALQTQAQSANIVIPGLEASNVMPNNSLAQPTQMVFIGPDDLLINLKSTGRVMRVTGGVVQPAPVLDLAVNGISERGLLGLALHPEFPAQPWVYLFYTATGAADGDAAVQNRLSRLTWNGTELTGEQILRTFAVSDSFIHNGGIIKFGPPTVAPSQQKMFIVLGDLDRNGRNENFADGAEPDDAGVVLRLNPDGTTPTGAERGPFYDIAAGNPSLEAMYAYGIRNSYGLDFDPVTGDLWDTENGFFDSDEINRILPGFNSGWETVMGKVEPEPTNLVQHGGVGTYSNPEFTWYSIVAPTAIHFYTGTALGSQFQHQVFVGSANNGKLFRFKPNLARTGFNLTGVLEDEVWINGETDFEIVAGFDFGIVTDIKTGPDGFLYVLSMTKGTLYKIQPGSTAAAGWELFD